MGSYTVQKGDTLYEIAKKHGVSLADLEKANPGVKPENLQIGQKLNLPGGGGSNNNSGSGSGKIPGSEGGSNGGGGYVNYSGPASSFPNPSQWAKYSVLWEQNKRLIGYNASAQETQWIKEGVEQVAKESGVDVRVILCEVVQESGGNPRVATTNNGVRNPGLMQSHNGSEFDPSHPKESILQMIRDGTEGTKSGDGFVQLWKKYGNWYECMRAYNSGSVNKGDLNDPVGATGDYVQKMANRLMGHTWNNM